MVGFTDRLRAEEPGRGDQSAHRQQTSGGAGPEPAPFHRPVREVQPNATGDRGAPAGPYGSRGCQEGRPDPRWRRLAGARQRQRPGQGSRRGDSRRCPGGLRVFAFSRRRLLATGLCKTLDNEKAITAIGFMHRARVWFAAHGIDRIERIVTDNGACYRANDFAHVLYGARHQGITPYTTTTGRWSATTGSWPRSSSSRGPGPQRPNAPRR